MFFAPRKPNTSPVSTPSTTPSLEQQVQVQEPSKPTTATPILLAPGAPVALERTDTSLTIAWSGSATDPKPDFASLKDDVNPDIEYEVKYARAGYKYDPWNSIGLVTCRRCIRIEGLIPAQGYIFQVRSRFCLPISASSTPQPLVTTNSTTAIDNNNTESKLEIIEDNNNYIESVNINLSKSWKIPSNPNKWSVPSESSKTLTTFMRDEQERIENLDRLRQFILNGAKGLPPFPEDPEIPDTYGAKAARTMEGLVSAVSKSGLGGTYFALVQSVWKIHKTGLASLVFHPDLQKTVYVLLTFLNTVAADIGLSSKDVVVGSYFALWEAKRQRLLHPLAEFEEHSNGLPGVIESQVPRVLLNELMFYFPLAGLAYRHTPAQIQWVLNKFTNTSPSNMDATNNLPQLNGFRLVSARTRSSKFRPAYFLAAHEDLKTAVFVIRGTSELEDLVTDGLCDVQVAPFRFGEDSHTFHVHAGMLQAARWLVRGDDRKRHLEDDEPLPSSLEGVPDEDLPEGAGVGAAVAKLWAAGYCRVVFTGHSLGGGVAVLSALLIADRFRDLHIKVYGYGTPAVVDEILAEACKGNHASSNLVVGLGNRVTVKNIIRHDDLVPRLSLLTARDFAIHLKETRSKWGPLLNEDIHSFTSRIKTVWAPAQRAHSISRGVKTARLSVTQKASTSSDSAEPLQLEDVKAALVDTNISPSVAAVEVPNENENGKKLPDIEMKDISSTTTVEVKVETATAAKKSEMFERLNRSLSNPLVVPGLIVHTYLHHGTHMASLVDYHFPPLRRLSAFQNCIDDHRFDEIMLSVRSVLFATAAREAGHLPPHWEGLNDHINDTEEWQVRCRVCTYPVSWHQASNSEAMEIRATHHCHSCGKIVCSKCSEGRVALPQIGIITPVRVCDLCKYHLFEPKHGQKNMFDIDEY